MGLVTSRRRLGMLGLLVGLGLIALSCSNGSTAGQPSGDASAAPSGTVSIFGFEDAVLPNIVNSFEKAYPGVHVNTATMSSNDEAVTKLQAGFQTDVIHICTSDTARMVKLGLIQPIDTSRIPQWKNMYSTFKDIPGTHVDGKLYMLPFEGGHSGIVYNPTQVSTPLTSYRQLFEDPQLAGKVTLENSPQSTIAIAALGLGYKDPWTLTNAQVDQVSNYIIQHIGNVRTFFDGDAQFINLYKSGEITAGFGYHDYPVTLKRAGEPVAFSDAEGSIAWVCGYAISSKSTNLAADYALINWYVTPQIQKYYVNQYTYLWVNKKTTPLIAPALVKQIGMNDPAATLGALIPEELPANYDQWLTDWAKIQSS